ncbi:MAG: DUF1566 domain-containing protein [Candidatus Electrothrix sp. Rat3]|nr:DUF1566 domain-containing protein [Candidatus Electrothrix rattekaaiensis]
MRCSVICEIVDRQSRLPSGTLTWQQPGTVNSGGGFAGYTDWRLPNIRELRSIVEEQCFAPAINAIRFPNTTISYVWSGSPVAVYTGNAWAVDFSYGNSSIYGRSYNGSVRLVRGGQ